MVAFTIFRFVGNKWGDERKLEKISLRCLTIREREEKLTNYSIVNSEFFLTFSSQPLYSAKKKSSNIILSLHRQHKGRSLFLLTIKRNFSHYLCTISIERSTLNVNTLHQYKQSVNMTFKQYYDKTIQIRNQQNVMSRTSIRNILYSETYLTWI